MRRKNAGFTLLEVLIALAVLGIALLALARAGQQQLKQQDFLHSRVLANWVADNVIVEARLDSASLTAGHRGGQRTMGGRDWYWSMLVQPSPDPALWRLDVAVFSDPEQRQAVFQQTGFAIADEDGQP